MKKLTAWIVSMCLFVCLCGCNAEEFAAAMREMAQTAEKAAENVGTKDDMRGEIHAAFIDVGQGDCEFVILPDGKTILIDAGTADSAGRIINYIKSCGVERLDYVIATHPHADHIGGMAEVIKAFDIGQIYMPKVSTNTKTFERLLLTIKEKGLSVNTAKAGVSLFGVDGISACFVAPVKEKYDDLNNYSAVLRLCYNDVSFLFTGDAEAESEAQIDGNIKADVLKVGHHGSSTSSSKKFIERVSPKIAVISCGTGNSYGHPHKETLERLENFGIKYYRTDENGTVVVSSDGKDISVKTE